MSGSVAHNPTDGLSAPVTIRLSGTGVSAIVTGQVYKVSLSLGGTNTVALTATLKDVAGSTFTTANGNSVTWKSYNTNVATVAAGTVTAVAAGQAIIEAQFPTADGTNAVGVDMVYVQIQVTVGP
jgi:uncharacterized protein YjdB